MKASHPVLINDSPIDVDRYFYLIGYFYINFSVDLHCAIEVDWFVNIDWLFDDDRLLVDRFVDVDLFLHNFRYSYLLHDDFRYFLFDFDVLGHLDDFLDYPLGSRDVFGNLYSDFVWFFYDDLLDGFDTRGIGFLFLLFFQHLVF